MPSTRGKVTPWARPSRVCSSERLIPNALTRMSTQPGRGSGTGSSRIRSASGGPGASSTTARMVAVMSVLLGHREQLVAERHDPVGGHSGQDPLPAAIVLSIDRDRRRIHRDRHQTEPPGWCGPSVDKTGKTTLRAVLERAEW